MRFSLIYLFIYFFVYTFSAITIRLRPVILCEMECGLVNTYQIPKREIFEFSCISAVANFNINPVVIQRHSIHQKGR